jgi:hypothetical protein
MWTGKIRTGESKSIAIHSDFFAVISPLFLHGLSGFAALLLDSALTELDVPIENAGYFSAQIRRLFYYPMSDNLSRQVGLDKRVRQR